MIADYELTANAWSNVTSGTSQETGQNLLIQNLSSANIRVEVGTSQPASASYGLLVEPYDSCTAEPSVGESVFVYTSNSKHIIHVEVV